MERLDINAGRERVSFSWLSWQCYTDHLTENAFVGHQEPLLHQDTVCS
jgi:hypothetical protein